MDNYAEILILIAGMWLGYIFNDIRRDMKEMKEQDKKDKERKDKGDELKKKKNETENKENRRHDEWTEVFRPDTGDSVNQALCRCSSCGDVSWVYDYSPRRAKYCQHCGADMRGTENG